MPKTGRSLRVLFAIAIPLVLQAARLPHRVYTTEDGMPGNRVAKILRDSDGFLWFGTNGGAARFDGSVFTTYGPAQGLPAEWVFQMAETPAGSLWFATDVGLYRLNRNSSGAKAIQVILGPGRTSVPTLDIDRAHSVLWVATRWKIFRVDADAEAPQAVEVSTGLQIDPHIGAFSAILVDQEAGIWCAAENHGLYHRWPDGRSELYTPRDGLPPVGSILQDRNGIIWLGTGLGIYRLTPIAGQARRQIELIYAQAGSAATYVQTIGLDSGGGLLFSTPAGIGEIPPGARPGDPPVWRFGRENGLVDTIHTGFAEDLAGNLWIGCESLGAIRVARDALLTYSTEDGLARLRVSQIFEDRAGNLLALVSEPPQLERWDGRRFESFPIPFPRGVDLAWRTQQVILQDRRGEWWVATQWGLLRFAAMPVDALPHARPKAFYSERDGLAGHDVIRIYQDRRGDIWVATTRSVHLDRWDSARQQWVQHTESEGLRFDRGVAGAFMEDRSGTMWVGGSGWIARYRGGRFETLEFGPADTSWLWPSYLVRDLYVDRSGRIWIAYGKGLMLVEDPSASEIRVRNFNSGDGLSADSTLYVTEDGDGRIYVGTDRGLDRLNPAAFPGNGSARHFSAAEGLPPGRMSTVYRDRRGTLWFGTFAGLSSYTPQADRARPPPDIWLTGVRVRDTAMPIGSGHGGMSPFELNPSQNQVRVEFAALSFWPGEEVRFQSKLEGMDANWSTPFAERSLNFNNLASGAYHLRVRAVGAGAVVSPVPISLDFTILQPLWLRWWFVALCALALGAAGFGLHRYSMQQAIALERMRTHIARDLHDEIGSSLSQIAILSEVARHQRTDVTVSDTIASIARELVDSMSDIVWAINPQHDRLGNLLHRMRRFGEETLGGCNIDLEFRGPAGEEAALRTDPEVRRNLFLVFKEAVANVARHSGARSARVELAVEGSWFQLSIADDGRGFDDSLDSDGNGLDNMRKRVEALGGDFRIVTGMGEGTRVSARIPVGPRRKVGVRG